MSLTIKLTEEIRSLAYFSDFKEDEVEIPAKPFIRELLAKTLDLESLSIEELCQCIETCIYFTLEPAPSVQELLWKVGSHGKNFKSFFKTVGKGVWACSSEKSPALIRAEIIKIYGTTFTRQLFVKMGIRWFPPNCLESIQQHNLRLLIWARERAAAMKIKIKSDRHWRMACKLAAKKGYLDCLRYLDEQGCAWNEETCYYAAKGGHLDCLQYAHEHGCPWDKQTCYFAAKGGHLECLKYAHEHGCPWDKQTCDAAAQHGHLDCLKYAYEQKCPYSSQIYYSTMGTGYSHLHCIRYLHEQGVPWDEEVTGIAAASGYLDCLQYAHEHGCPWDEDACRLAAQEGHLACLQYAHEHGCPWDEDVCMFAAGNGHLACLQYAHEHGCPWDNNTVGAATDQRRNDCLQYALAHGCPDF